MTNEMVPDYEKCLIYIFQEIWKSNEESILSGVQYNFEISHKLPLNVNN